VTGIVILPQRNPVVLAKEVASLDVLSGGRVTLGVGAGYLEPEFRAAWHQTITDPEHKAAAAGLRRARVGVLRPARSRSRRSSSAAWPSTTR
jgi:alkanesulfonate monooxygenase SsuD/methylene tetrahydromethanopterin reductase-like flavin-dependent oxidoreductase (luciferase family)